MDEEEFMMQVEAESKKFTAMHTVTKPTAEANDSFFGIRDRKRRRGAPLKLKRNVTFLGK